MEGHYDKVSKTNQLGGSKAYCSWRYKLANILNSSKINKLLITLPIDLYYNYYKLLIVIAKGDSREMSYYWHPQDKYCLSNLQNDTIAKVTLPNA